MERHDSTSRRRTTLTRLGLALLSVSLLLVGWSALPGEEAPPATPVVADPVAPAADEAPSDAPMEEAFCSVANPDESSTSRTVRTFWPAPLPSLDDIVDLLQGDEPLECLANRDRVLTAAIKPGQVLSSAFAEHDIDYPVMLQVLEAFRGVYDFRRLRPGMRWRVEFDSDGRLTRYMMQTDRLTALFARRNEDDRITAHTVTGSVTTVLAEVAGSIQASLSVSLWKQGETDALTQEIADIFAWDIDFYSDIQKGDTYRIIVEKRFYRDEFLGYGRVMAAVFDGRFMGHRSAYYFQSPDGLHAGYFDRDGNTLEKSFLRAPLNTTRVTSTYGFRFHPILKKVKPHNGIDYAAPTGTPIWAITSGKVLRAGRMGGCGIGAVLSHAGGYESTYCHMSSLYVRTGQTVQQKKMLGRVGCTGYCTGPHLHFGMKKDGRYFNPAKMKFEPGKPIDPRYRDAYATHQTRWFDRLSAIELPVFHGPDTPDGMIVTEAGLVADPDAPPQTASKASPQPLGGEGSESGG